MESSERGSVRPAIAAGTFYPGEEIALKSSLDSLFQAAERLERSAPGPVRALIIPHAGYSHSGVVAAVALSAVTETPRRIVLLGPAHRVAFRGISGGDYSGYETPGGAMRVDREALGRLEEAGFTIFKPEAHVQEHSLEVVIPLLMERFGDIPLVPLLAGTAEDQDVAQLLEEVLEDGDLLVVSSDLSHFLDDERCRTKDAGTLSAIVEGRTREVGPYEACGHLGIGGLSILARQRGWTPHLLEYSNSGESGGDLNRVVGYGAVVFTVA